MAEAFDLDVNLDADAGVWDAYDQHLVKQTAPRGESSWLDVPKDFIAGLTDVGANAAASAQYAAGDDEGMAAAARRAFTAAGDYMREGLSPEYRRRQALPIIGEPGEATVFDEPTYGAMASVIGTKAASSLGAFATFIGATVLGSAAGTAVGGPAGGVVGGRLGAGAAGGVFGGGGTLKDIYAESDKVSDEKLAQIPMVQQLLEQGKDLKEARAEWNRVRMGALPLFNAALGIAASQVGVGGALARSTARAAMPKATGRIAGAGRTGAEEGLTEATEGLSNEFSKQWASIAGGLQEDFSGSKLLNAPAEGFVVGGLMGAGTGAATGGAKAPTQKPVQETSDVGGLDIEAALKASGVEPPVAPVAAAPVAPVAAAPVAPAAAAPVAPVAAAPVAPAAPAAPAPPAATAPVQEAAPVSPTPQVTQPETPTVLETPATLEAQVTDLEDGVRNVVLFPTGTKMADRPAMPEGMKSATIKGQGVVYYNPASGLVGKDFQTMDEATLSKLLNMSGTTKEDVLAAVGRGAQPAVINVSNEEGVDVVNAATSSETINQDIEAIAAKARPTDTIGIGTPQDVIAERQAAAPVAPEAPVTPKVTPKVAQAMAAAKPPAPPTPAAPPARVLRAAGEEDFGRGISVEEKADVQDYAGTLTEQAEAAAKEKAEPKPGNRSNEEQDARRELNAQAEKISKSYPVAADVESEYMLRGAKAKIARAAILTRARAMLAAAKDAGMELPQRIRENVDPEMNHGPATLRLLEAQFLIKKAGLKKGAEKADFDRFLSRDIVLVKGGEDVRKEVASARAQEGGQKRQGGAGSDAALETTTDTSKLEGVVSDATRAATTTPEALLEAKQEKESESTGLTFEEGNERKSVVGSKIEAVKAAVAKRAEEKQRRVEALVKAGATEGERAAATAAKDRLEAAKTTAMETAEAQVVNQFVTQGRDKAGTFKVGGTKELRPKVEGKVSLKPKPKILPLEVQAREDQQQARSPAASLDDIAAAFTIRSTTVSDIMRGVKINDLADVVRDNKLFTKLDQRLQRALAPQMMRALRKSVPDVKVNVLSDEGYALIAPPRTLGFYNPETDTITLTEAAFSDPKVLAWVIAHESAHAAFSKAIAQNREIKKQLLTLMAHVKTKLAFNPMLGASFTQNAPIDYGFKNADEFIAEAWSNPAFQRLLASTEIPASMAEAVGIRPADRSRVRSVWDWLRFKVASILDLPTASASAFDAVLRISEDLQALSAQARATAAKDPAGPSFLELPAVTQKTAEDLSVNIGGKLRRLKDRLKTTSMIARDMGDGLWKGTDAPIRAVQLRRAIDTKQSEILSRVGGEELINDHAILQRKNPELYARMADLGYGYTVYDINPGGADANPQIGQNKRKYWQAVEKMPELDAEFARIATIDPAYTKLMVRTSSTFKSIQNEVGLKEIQNILDKVGVNEPGLAERIHSDGMTEADTAKFATDAATNALNDARAFKKISGLYLPEMRRGDFIVYGRVDLEKYVPKTATQIDQDTMVFTGNGNFAQAERDVKAFLKGLDLKESSTRKIYVDKNDPQTQLEKDDVDSVPVLRVRMQTQFTSFVETEAEAKALATSMESDGALDVKYQIKKEAIGPNSKVLTSDMKRIERGMMRSENFKNLSKGEQNTALQAMRELALRLDGDGRLGHRRMYRRNVEGFSKDLLANTQQYLGQSAGYLARLEYQPKVDAAIKEMDAYMTARKDVSLADAAKMREQYNTLVERIEHTELPQSGATNSFTRRLLQISLLNKLASPAYHVINAHEPWTIAAPYMVGRHKLPAVIASMGSAYKRLGVGGAIGKGIIDTARAFGQNDKFTNFQDYFLNRMKAAGMSEDALTRTKDMFDHLHTTGLFDREAGMEVTRLNDPSSNIFGRGLDKAEVVFRQMAVTMEAINRSVVSLAAYELEFKRTGNHEAAKNYAYETIHDTMGDYSATNASPIFNSQLGRLALQFKKYAQKTYWLLGRTIAHAFKGDREAMKQFAGLMFTTGLMTGVLGLPLEPIKIALLASGALLGTGFSYDDFEDLIRRTAAGILGVKGGEVFSRGIYRTINVEVANRMGMDSLLTFGQPRGPTQQDLKSWLFDTAGGAPVGTVMNQIASLNSLMAGFSKTINGGSGGDDYLAALEKSMAPKLVTDITKAYRGATIGKESASGRQTLAPYSPTEAVMKAIGFTPAREFEQQRLRSQVFEQTRQQTAERTKFNQQWFKAGPAERAKMWGQIEKWNAGRPKDAQLTRSALDRYVKTRNTQESSGKVVDGITVNKANQYIYDQASGTYNTR